MNVLCRKRPSRYFAILTWYLFSDSCSIFSKLFSLLSSDDSRLSWSQSFWKQRNSNCYLSMHQKLPARQKLNAAATNKPILKRNQPVFPLPMFSKNLSTKLIRCQLQFFSCASNVTFSCNNSLSLPAEATSSSNFDNLISKSFFSWTTLSKLSFKAYKNNNIN